MQKNEMLMPKEAQDRIRDVFERIEDGSLRRTGEARGELDALERRMEKSERRSVFTKGFIEELVGKVKGARDAKRRAYLLSALTMLIWRVSDSMHATLFDLMMEEILHDDAHVRLSAVHMAERLRTDLHMQSERDREQLWVERVSRITRLIRERMPQEWREREAFDPVYVRSLKASPLKSLLLVWKACAYTGSESEAWHEKHLECALGFPVEWWDDPALEIDEEDELPTREEVAESMWEDSPPSKRARLAFAELATMSEARFRNELVRSQLLDPTIAHHIEMLKKAENGAIVDVLIAQMHLNNRKKGGEPKDVNPLIRELQAFWNHIKREDAHGNPASYFAITCLRTRNAYNRKEPRDIGACIVRLAEAHRAINAMGETFLTKKQTADAKHLAWVEKYFREDVSEEREKSTKEYEESFAPRMQECVSIAHHALDWYVSAEPWHFEKKTPQKWAAIALDIVRWANEGPERGHFRWLPYERKDLGPLGGWKVTIGYGALSAWATVRDSVEDPDLLLLQSDELDRDWENDVQHGAAMGRHSNTQ